MRFFFQNKLGVSLYL